MKRYNYHTHTYRCGHAAPLLMDEDYVKEYIKMGFDHIAFTDHMPEKVVIDKRDRVRMRYDQIDEYLSSIKSLKEKYKDVIAIDTGFEVEYLPGQEDNLFELKNMVDKLVLGQHFIYKDNFELKHVWGNEFNDDDLKKFANYIIEAMKLGIPDVIVHPDIFMKCRSDFGSEEEKATRSICESAEKYNIPLEINLAQIRRFIIKKTNHIEYPSKDFWNIAKEYNIKVLYGIDAHFKDQITLYDEEIKFVNKYLGDDIINNLNFIDTI